MKALSLKINALTADYKESGHPVDINVALEPVYLKAAVEVSTERALSEPIPKLCTLVTASAFDAAIHDAFGKLHGLNCYRTYGREFMTHDLGWYLGPEYKGEYLSQYVTEAPKARMPMYHLVGALDPITKADVTHPVGDGLPETLAEWIPYNGLTHFKIKLNGNQLEWDINRVLSIDRAVRETKRRAMLRSGFIRLISMRNAPNVDYLVDFCGW